MKNKDEISDTDSGIIVQSGPDSPVAPMKDLTQAMRKQQRVLEERLEACVQELKRLCLREAELTGMVPSEYPLKAGEKPPKVRRRIGAAFKLDEKAILSKGADPVSTLERDLALQLQIAEAARCLSREENLTKQVRKRRKSAVLKEEKKLKDLEQALDEYRLAARHLTPLRASAPALEEFSASDESSLSDVALVEEGPQLLNSPPSKPTPLAHQPLHGSSSQPPPDNLPEGQIHYQPTELESAPIQNSPWKETSLDKPYKKTKKPTEPTSIPSPGLMPQPAPSSTAQRIAEPPLCHFVPVRKTEVRRQTGSSAPPTPEFLGRRGQSQAIRMCSSREGMESRGRSALPRRRPTYYTVTVPEYCFSAPKSNPTIQPTYHSASEDSNSDVSSISYTTSAGSSSPDISFLKPIPPTPMEEALQPFQSQVCKGHEAGYHSQGPQKMLSAPGYFSAIEYATECLLPAGREPCYGRPHFPSASSAPFAYKEEAMSLRFHGSIVSQSRVVRTPSLKDCLPRPSTGTWVLSKSAVTEELKSWHERTRLRNARPHSLDRQGAFRMRSGPGRELRTACSMGQQTQVPRVHILKRSPEGAPVQVYVPENGEIITQV
ncbi:innate immunity activator protein isoform X2 [Sphaerodactylus townsendi]|uniref:innate immunity activator protein isoform X2 n=1 Tax=Sphaerodactylus townsendi TaxID=933632 RepID=UPI002026218A|nr:innate immunity activator protein isoform X2 [Sphaerodactylus townsendi]